MNKYIKEYKYVILVQEDNCYMFSDPDKFINVIEKLSHTRGISGEDAIQYYYEKHIENYEKLGADLNNLRDAANRTTEIFKKYINQ